MSCPGCRLRGPDGGGAAAGDDARAKASVEAFIESLGLRPLDAGGLKMAHWLEGAGVITMGLANHGVGNWDFSLSITELPA